MPPRVLRQHAEYHVAVELVLGLGGRAGIRTNEWGTSDAVRAGRQACGGEAGRLTSERVGRQNSKRRAPQLMGDVGSVRSSGARRLLLPSPVPGGEVELSLAGGIDLFTLLVRGRRWQVLAPSTCRAGSPPYAESSPSRPLRALEARHAPLASSPPETLGCEDIRFVVVLGSDP